MTPLRRPTLKAEGTRVFGEFREAEMKQRISTNAGVHDELLNMRLCLTSLERQIAGSVVLSQEEASFELLFAGAFLGRQRGGESVGSSGVLIQSLLNLRRLSDPVILLPNIHAPVERFER